MNLFLVLCLVACFLGIYFQINKSAQEKKIMRFSSREELNESKLYEEFFSEYGIKNDVIEILHHVSGETQIPIGILRPNDQFTKELSSEKGWEFDDGSNLLFEYLDKLVTKQGKILHLNEIVSLGDYLRTRLDLEKETRKAEL